MAKKTGTTAAALKKMITDLKKQRQDLVSQIAEIDRTFAQLGMEAESPAPATRRKPGPKPGSKRKKTTKKATGKKASTKKSTRKAAGRRKFKQNAEEAVLSFITSSKTPPTTKQVNDHWKSLGRGGSADNTLTKLTKEKKIKRIPIKGKRGSQYTAA